MKKLTWTGTETEFLEFMIFVDTVLYEISDRFENFKHPTILESADFLEHFIEVDYKKSNNFFNLRMHGRPIGIFFHSLLRVAKIIKTNTIA